MALLLNGKYSHEDRHLSFLPWAHIYGQSVELHGAVFIGASLACTESRETIVTDLPLAKPTVLVAVPQLFYRIFAGVNEKASRGNGVCGWQLRDCFFLCEGRKCHTTAHHTPSYTCTQAPKSGIKKIIYDWALRVGRKRRDVLNQHKEM